MIEADHLLEDEQATQIASFRPWNQKPEQQSQRPMTSQPTGKRYQGPRVMKMADYFVKDQE